MRDDALATVGAQGPAFTITQVETDAEPVAREAPPRADDRAALPQPPRRRRRRALVRDASGKPMQNGTAQYPFVVLIPPSATDTTPAPILQNGHGLLGSLDEGTDSYFAQMCGQYNYIGVAVDWIGMAPDDNQTLVDAITQTSTSSRTSSTGSTRGSSTRCSRCA